LIIVHWVNNLGLVALNTVLLRLLFPAVAGGEGLIQKGLIALAPLAAVAFLPPHSCGEASMSSTS
jgi:hypothetical protein